MRAHEENKTCRIMMSRPKKGSHLPLFHIENELKLKNNKLKLRK